MKISSTTSILVTVFIVLGGLFGMAIWKQMRPTGLDDFAKCLTNNGAVMESAWWCPHCQQQKALFGRSFRFVKSIECGAGKGQFNTEACPNVKSTPTWVDKDGKRYEEGRVELSRLGEIFSCQLPPQ